MSGKNPPSHPNPHPPTPLSLYIHLPFCKQKCHYCDFVSYAGKEDLIDSYVDKIMEEIQSSPLSSDYRRNSFPSPSSMERGVTNKVSDGVRTLFFGGGTPTLLEPKYFAKIINAIICHFLPSEALAKEESLLALRSFSEGGGIGHSEITVESNPGTANFDKLKTLRELGINRLSIGAQSFNDQHLKTLGRIHDAKQIYKFYDDARAAGFDNTNLDLIFALPNQTLEEWQTDLKTAISLKPEHLSCYCLEGKMAQLSEDQELAMYEYTIETLTAAGYKHYEISNFAKPGFECQHNINYWQNGNYLGFGAGAHSHVNGRRWANPSIIEDYTKETATFSRRFPDNQTASTDRRETIFMGLRLLEGLPKAKFAGFEKVVNELIQDGLLEEQNGNYRLSRRGLCLGNLVFEKFV